MWKRRSWGPRKRKAKQGRRKTMVKKAKKKSITVKDLDAKKNPKGGHKFGAHGEFLKYKFEYDKYKVA
jgi:hypothetical protein